MIFRQYKRSAKTFSIQAIKVVLQGYPRCPDSHDLSECHHVYDLVKHPFEICSSINPQTTMRGPMDPRQHSTGCESEMENDPAGIFRLIVNRSKYCQIIAHLQTQILPWFLI